MRLYKRTVPGRGNYYSSVREFLKRGLVAAYKKV